MGSFTVYHVNQGVSLAQAREKGQLVFIEGLKESLGVLLQGESSKGTQALDFLRYLSVALTLIKPTGLKSMFIQSAVSGGEEWGPPCDPGGCPRCGPESGGQCWGSVGAALDFSHYCRATVCSELMVMLVRCEWLLRGLINQCSLTLQVQGLPTGYCRDIHRQVRWIRLFVQQTQKKLFQYKVHDKGASFFARGTSSAVL
uniref:Elongator acetyltransferase complex subunit 6 n=1 Tax=Oncorhynchus kisutch TaxID=8019 RepID=A0A8C7I2T5_ONCKI